MVHRPPQDIGDGLDAAVGMPGKPGAVIVRAVIAKIVQQQIKGHVWTAPAVQEEFDYQRSVRVRSCIRPLSAAVWPLALM